MILMKHGDHIGNILDKIHIVLDDDDRAFGCIE